MKIFVSWSGELSKQIAQILKIWLPRLIQSLDVFYSPDDIEKGDNWDSKISQELSACNYGIVCLTAENTTAPWIHFEAGALAKALEARVSALMININPSDIKGPLSRYQATRLEKDDFAQLIESINKALESPLDNAVLLPLLDALWPTISAEFEKAVKSCAASVSKAVKKQPRNDPLEEILQLLRKQNALLSNPEELLPAEYLEYLQKSVLVEARGGASIVPMLFDYIENVIRMIEHCEGSALHVLTVVGFDEIFQILDLYIHQSFSSRAAERYFTRLMDLHEHYVYVLRNINKNVPVPVSR